MVLEQLDTQWGKQWTVTSASAQKVIWDNDRIKQKAKTVKLLEENIQYICNVQISKDFLNEKQKAIIIKKVIIMDFIKIKIFYSSKNTVKKGRPQTRRKYLQYINLTKNLQST